MCCDNDTNKKHKVCLMNFRVLLILTHFCDINQVTSLKIVFSDEAGSPGVKKSMIKRFQKKLTDFSF